MCYFGIMQFTEGSFYHIYNRGNDKGTLFFQERNYSFFLQKVKKYIAANSNMLAWCLMPNHFHFLVQANEDSVRIVKESPIKINALTEGIRQLLSSYTKAIQKQEFLTGNLFQQKTKFKCVDEYTGTVFHYIHQNPMRACLVKDLDQWKWSSWNEYAGNEEEVICKREIACLYIDLDGENFKRNSSMLVPDNFIEKII